MSLFVLLQTTNRKLIKVCGCNVTKISKVSNEYFKKASLGMQDWSHGRNLSAVSCFFTQSPFSLISSEIITVLPI